MVTLLLTESVRMMLNYQQYYRSKGKKRKKLAAAQTEYKILFIYSRIYCFLRLPKNQ